MAQQREKNEILQKEKLDIFCSNCHFVWNLNKRKDNFKIDQLEKKLLLDLKYEPIETVAAFTLLAFLYYKENDFVKASEYASTALFVLGIANVQSELSRDPSLCEAIEKAKLFNNNAQRYVAMSVYLHILYKIKDWGAMDEYFHKINTIALTVKDQCQIQLIKGYAYKKISPPHEPEALNCFVLAQSLDPDEPEAIFQEAIAREKIRCTHDSFISPLSLEERKALEKVIDLWSNNMECRAYPETLLITAQLGDKIHQLLELEKQNGTNKLKNPKANTADREENYSHVKDYALKIEGIYIRFKPHFRYVNRAYFACLRAMKNLCFISIKPGVYNNFFETQRLMTEKALTNHSDDPSVLYHAGSFYLSAYRKNKRQTHYYDKAKSYFKACTDSPFENKWAELRLLEFETNEHDVKIASEQLLQKYKDSTEENRSSLHFHCAQALEKFKNSKSQAKFYYLEAIKLNPDHRKTMMKLLHLIGYADNIETWYETAEVYILSGLESKDYLEHAYSNIKRVYDESSTYESVAMYYCKVLIYKFTNTKETSYLYEAMEIVNKNESQDDMIDLKIKIYMHFAEISKESNEKLHNSLLAGRCGSIDGCKQALYLMEALAEGNNQYYTSEEAYKYCAVADLKLNTNCKVRNLENVAVEIEEINKRIRWLLMLDDSDLLTGNKDLLHFRRKRYEMCCSYEEIVGYNIGDDSKEKNTSGPEMEFFMLGAENVLLFTRILLDRAFKTFCKKYYSCNIKGKDVYYPTFSAVPDSIQSARGDMLEYLQEKYHIEEFENRFAQLLSFLANHQKYIEGGETMNGSLPQYFLLSNYSKHEKSITSGSLMNLIKKLFPSCKDSPFLAFVETACVYTEDVVSELSKAEPSSTIPTSDSANISGTIQSTDQKRVVIFCDSFIGNIRSKWESRKFELRNVIFDANKSAFQCIESFKEEDTNDLQYVVFQLGIDVVLKETEGSVAKLAWKVLTILHDFMQTANKGVKLLIGGIPEVKLPEATGDGSKHNILSSFNEIVQKGCVFIPDTYFVANTKFHYGLTGHISKVDEISYKLSEKGQIAWIRSVQNGIKKM